MGKKIGRKLINELMQQDFNKETIEEMKHGDAEYLALYTPELLEYLRVKHFDTYFEIMKLATLGQQAEEDYYDRLDD